MFFSVGYLLSHQLTFTAVNKALTVINSVSTGTRGHIGVMTVHSVYISQG